MLEGDESDFVAQLEYKIINDKEMRQHVVSSNAFCNFHFYQMARLSSPIVNAVLTRDLIEDEIREIEEKTSRVTDGVDCLVCTHIAGREDFYLDEFKALLQERSFQKDYEGTDGLCRIHLIKVLDSLKEGEWSQYLLRTHLMHLKLLRVGLESFISKVRSTERDLGAEKDSWWIAIEKWVGKKGLTPKQDLHKK